MLFRVKFGVIISVSLSKGSTVFCKLKLHVLRQENLVCSLKFWFNPGLNLTIFQGTGPWAKIWQTCL